MRHRHTRPIIRRQVPLALDTSLVDAAKERAHRQGLSLPEYVERLTRRDVGMREVAEKVDKVAMRREPIVTLWSRDFRRRLPRILVLASRLRRPLIIRGGATRLGGEVRGRPKCQLVIWQRYVMLPVKRGAGKRRQRRPA